MELSGDPRRDLRPPRSSPARRAAGERRAARGVNLEPYRLGGASSVAGCASTFSNTPSTSTAYSTSPPRKLTRSTVPANTLGSSGIGSVDRFRSSGRITGSTAASGARSLASSRLCERLGVSSTKRLWPSAPPPSTRACSRWRRRENRDERRARPGVDLPRRAFLHDAAALHHRDAVGQRERLGLVVGDEQRGDADARDHLGQLVAHRLAQPRVEVRQRLVEQQQRGPPHQRARQRDALLLAARQPRGRARRPSAAVPTSASASITRSRISARGSAGRCTRSGYATFSNTSRCGQIA